MPALATQVRGLDLPDRLIRAVEELQQFLRVRGGLLPNDKLDAYISRRDLIEWGFATTDTTAVPVTGGGIAPVPGGGGDGEPDYTPPPTPSGVTAIGGYTSIFVSWAAAMDRRIGYFEVWRAAVDDVGVAVKIGQATSFQYVDEVQNSDSFFYWVRAVNAWNDEVVSPFNAVAGTPAQTAPNASYALEVLTGTLGEQPFFEITEPTTIGGVEFQPGVYMKSLVAKKAIAEVFVAGLAVIDDASIVSVKASKILADKLGVGQYIASQNYVAGSTGWRINADGTAEFSGVVVRGTIYASAGLIGGIVIGSTYLQSAGFVSGANGYRLNLDGTSEFNDVIVRGTVYASAGMFAGALNGATGTFAGALSAATGTFAGALSAATGTFAGSLSAATGTFSGSLTAAAINAVDTVNIRGQAVSFMGWSDDYDSGPGGIGGVSDWVLVITQVAHLYSLYGGPVVFTITVPDGFVFSHSQAQSNRTLNSSLTLRANTSNGTILSTIGTWYSSDAQGPSSPNMMFTVLSKRIEALPPGTTSILLVAEVHNSGQSPTWTGVCQFGTRYSTTMEMKR
ncbi:MAG: hypothetical protein J0H00_10800 [Burkholderiales bacterium]|nr:hypothetical protein [Burkholderiales bacterium]